jgi:hypothetical protein
LSPLTPVLPLGLCGSFSMQEHTDKIPRLLFALERPFGRSPLTSSVFVTQFTRPSRSWFRFVVAAAHAQGSVPVCLCSCVFHSAHVASAPGVGSAHFRFSLPASAAVFVSILRFRQISAAQGFCSRVSFEPVDQFVFFVLCLLCLGLKVHCHSVLIHLQAQCHP